MTTSRYILARIAKSFGLLRRQKRMSEAASETHLLKDAEYLLGTKIWQHTEPIEEISLEYWNLRQLNSKKEKIQERLDQYEAQIAEAYEERAQALNQKNPKQSDLEEKREACLRELDTFTQERNKIIDEARNLRRQYDAAKAKLEVVGKENQANDSRAADTRSHMDQLKKKLGSRKKQRDQIVQKIERQERLLDELETQIAKELRGHRDRSADSLKNISDLNKKISSEKAELGILESQMHEHYSSIGRHVSRYADIDPNCRKATANHRALVNVMKALRLSIQLNYKLVDR